MVEISAGNLFVDLAPETGGSVASFRLRRGDETIDLMRPLGSEDRRGRNPVGAAMFPMVPFANRIAGNEFTFEGRRYTFAANNPPEKFHVHGTAWQSAWTVHEATVDRAVLGVTVDAPGAPYRYRAREIFALSPEGLTVTTEVENRGEVAMPYGFGQHPWFPRDPDTEVHFRARTFWIEGWDHVASERIATPPELGFTEWTRLPRARRNNCYGGWDGRVDIRWPSRNVGLRIEAEPIFKHLMLYADPARRDFCLEPQTNAVCAFNMIDEDLGDTDLGVIVLAPGDSAGGTMTFTPIEGEV